ncbi:hypothetical protein [Marinicauda algicola]|uniref:hypothetical protein n=1 Tax=Marinicauda algicola TaxID=2029849 RepID=UPI001F1382DD|nr:hypothetical protein [Marinicauda algicola]
MTAPKQDSVVLSIEPRSMRLAFVAADRDGRLFDWGGFELRPCPRYRKCRERAATLCLAYDPAILILEDVDHASSLRRERMKQLVRDIESDARTKRLSVVKISRRRVLQRFCAFGTGSSADVAAGVCAYYPELSTFRPKKRAPWDNEHYSKALFEAAARLLTFFPDPRAEPPQREREP